MNEFLNNTKDFVKENPIGKVFFYILIMGLAIYFSFFRDNKANNNASSNEGNNNNITEKEKLSITLPSSYDYNITVYMDDDTVNYKGTVLGTDNSFIKAKDDKEISYKILDKNTMYLKKDEDYVLTTIDEIYDILPYSYLNIDSINNYLAISHEEEGEYRTYIKDIILNNTSEKYISIINEDRKIQIDYTSLLKELNYSVEKGLVIFEYSEREE